MNKIVTAALGVWALLALVTPATAAGRTVSTILEDCQSNGQTCQLLVGDLITNGRASHYICVPSSLSSHDAALQEIEWLKEQAKANPKLGDRNLEDTLWDGATELWPCHKR